VDLVYFGVGFIGFCGWFIYKFILSKIGKERIQYSICDGNKIIVKTPYKLFIKEEADDLMDIVKNPDNASYIVLTDKSGKLCVLPKDVITSSIFKMKIKKSLF